MEILPLQKGHVYAVEFDDGIVKIGSTMDANMRFWQLERREPKKRIVRACVSEKTELYRVVERLAQDGLTSVWKKEYYSIPYQDAEERIAKYLAIDFSLGSRIEVITHFRDLATAKELYCIEMRKRKEDKGT